MNRKMLRGPGFFLLMFLLIVILANLFSVFSNPTGTQIEYTQFLEMVRKGDIRQALLTDSNIIGITNDTKILTFPKGGYDFKAAYPSLGVLYTDLCAIRGITQSVPVTEISSLDFGFEWAYEPPAEQPWWLAFVPYVILMVLLMAVMYFFFTQQAQGGGGGGNRMMSFGKSRARMHTEEQKKFTFADLAGVEEEKAELQEIVEFLKAPKRFLELGARIPKGVLLIGPPGTGKTLLSKAVAGEAGVPFFSISGSDFVEMFVGVGASRVRDLFEQAKKNSPCIVFIDEIDAVGRQRGAGMGGGHDEREQTLNQLLVEMDGFAINEGIIILAATNRPDILDPALLRPGRFDREVMMGLPDIKGREAVLQVHARNKPFADDVSLKVIAKRTPGFTPADLENVLNEAAILTAREDKKFIGMQEIEEAINRVYAGPEKKSRVVTEKDKRLVAYHEAGHAIVSRLLPEADPVHMVTIIPRGQAGGVTMRLPKEDINYQTKRYLLDLITISLGGRAAEHLVLDDISTGASSDLQSASGIARRMVTEFGMSEVLGPVTFGGRHEEVFVGRDFMSPRNFSENVAALIDGEVKSMVEGGYRQALELLEDNMEILHRVAQTLIEVETLTADEFEAVFNSQPIAKQEQSQKLDIVVDDEHKESDNPVEH